MGDSKVVLQLVNLLACIASEDLKCVETAPSTLCHLIYYTVRLPSSSRSSRPSR